ncbi:MAG: hypothetical protein GKR89_36565 [Candidatus Latescibacteria bacterium]|nr:hypothetical protein [Candidatus Latescibacterota bacterium]
MEKNVRYNFCQTRQVAMGPAFFQRRFFGYSPRSAPYATVGQVYLSTNCGRRKIGMEKDEIGSRIKATVVRALQLQIDPEELGDEEVLFDSGVGVDSVASLSIISAIEEEFDLVVEDDELRPELFNSIASMRDYVVEKLQLVAQ